MWYNTYVIRIRGEIIVVEYTLKVYKGKKEYYRYTTYLLIAFTNPSQPYTFHAGLFSRAYKVAKSKYGEYKTTHTQHLNAESLRYLLLTEGINYHALMEVWHYEPSTWYKLFEQMLSDNEYRYVETLEKDNGDSIVLRYPDEYTFWHYILYTNIPLDYELEELPNDIKYSILAIKSLLTEG